MSKANKTRSESIKAVAVSSPFLSGSNIIKKYAKQIHQSLHWFQAGTATPRIASLTSDFSNATLLTSDFSNATTRLQDVSVYSLNLTSNKQSFEYCDWMFASYLTGKPPYRPYNLEESNRQGIATINVLYLPPGIETSIYPNNFLKLLF